MAKRDLSTLYSNKENIGIMQFDAMTAPGLYDIMSVSDVTYIDNLARSLKYNAKLKYKQQEIDRVMKAYGFTKLSGGTNRVVYRNAALYPSIVLKISTCIVGCADAPREYQNQKLVKPYVTKCYSFSPGGSVGVYEYCNPIRDRAEFMAVGGLIYDMLRQIVISKGYFIEDTGTNKFLNYCIREGFGPVICDYPYMYRLTKHDLFCDVIEPDGTDCGGLIGIDSGFNYLYCTKCGKRHNASSYGVMVGSTEISLKGERLPFVGDEVMNSTASLIRTMDGIEVLVNKRDLPETKASKAIIRKRKEVIL